ncbi:MAG: methyltransferase domain-containing protein, partial [Candidatus Subteraquimicrobiales bacterium]|nr:methyltransferase domain-containing protein [Candidatus Subteraquimicrobiales bacterium]
KDNNEVLGLEISETYRPLLSKKGILHKIGELKDTLPALPVKYYDLITFWDVFEHLKEPEKILSLVKDKLSSDGVIINWTSNYDDFISRFAEMTYKLSFGRIKYFMEQGFNRINGHNYNFVHKSLELLYMKNGLKIADTVITDTPSNRLTKSIAFRAIIEMFYLLNSTFRKGKIICHVLKRN